MVETNPQGKVNDIDEVSIEKLPMSVTTAEALGLLQLVRDIQDVMKENPKVIYNLTNEEGKILSLNEELMRSRITYPKDEDTIVVVGNMQGYCQLPLDVLVKNQMKNRIQGIYHLWRDKETGDFLLKLEPVIPESEFLVWQNLLFRLMDLPMGFILNGISKDVIFTTFGECQEELQLLEEKKLLLMTDQKIFLKSPEQYLNHPYFNSFDF